MDNEEYGFYLIGNSDYEAFIKTDISTRPGMGNKIGIVTYGLLDVNATIFYTYEEAEKAISELKERTNDILFRNALVIQDIIDKQSSFDYTEFVNSLKIYKMIPKLVE